MVKYIKAANFYWQRISPIDDQAVQLGIYDMLVELSEAISEIGYVDDVDFDLDSFKDLGQIIILVKYGSPIEEYNVDVSYNKIARKVIDKAREFGLKYSGDTVEDMGSWIYLVFNYDKPVATKEEK